jgi:ATP-dependent DNA helicase RecG
VIHTICAYANDFSNINGGYIVIGIEEDHGRPLLLPQGVDPNDLDKIQNELFQYCNLIEPRYIPQVKVRMFLKRKLLRVLCSGR